MEELHICNVHLGHGVNTKVSRYRNKHPSNPIFDYLNIAQTKTAFCHLIDQQLTKGIQLHSTL